MKKIVAIITGLLVVSAMVLVAMQKINPLTFWIVTGLGAVVAFFILPKLN
jgi:hypothetical protein